MQYIINPEELHVTWTGFHDKEGRIQGFLLQVFMGDECNTEDLGDEHHFYPMSDIRDVRNITEITFYDYTFQRGA